MKSRSRPSPVSQKFVPVGGLMLPERFSPKKPAKKYTKQWLESVRLSDVALLGTSGDGPCFTLSDCLADVENSTVPASTSMYVGTSYDLGSCTGWPGWLEGCGPCASNVNFRIDYNAAVPTDPDPDFVASTCWCSWNPGDGFGNFSGDWSFSNGDPCDGYTCQGSITPGMNNDQITFVISIDGHSNASSTAVFGIIYCD